MIPYTVIAVLNNFNFNSLHEHLTPLVLTLQPDNGSIAARIDAGKIQGLLTQIKATWKRMAPSQPFSYSFLDRNHSPGEYPDNELRSRVWVVGRDGSLDAFWKLSGWVL